MLLTYQQAAKQIGVTAWTVKSWVRSRQLSVVRFGHRTVRIKEAELDKLIERKTRKAR